MESLIGKRCVRNARKWRHNDFDGWGRGVGVGTIVQSPEGFEDVIDVRWPGGRCFEEADQICIEEDGIIRIPISHEEVQNLRFVSEDSQTFEGHFTMHYGWSPFDFPTVMVIEEDTFEPKIVITL